MRWLVKWQVECREKLLTDEQKAEDSHFFEFNVAPAPRRHQEPSMRHTRSAYGALFTQNEVRRFESMPGVDYGDEIRNPLNMDDPGADNEERARRTAARMARRTRRGRHSACNYATGPTSRRNASGMRRPIRNDSPTGSIGSTATANGSPGLRDHLVPWGQGGPAETWCRRSQEILDLVVSTATPAELAAAIGESLAEWPARVDAAVREAFPQEAKA